MDKFSIIIPTMQKNTEILNMLLAELDASNSVDEIIIIDNSLKGIDFKSNKLKVIIPEDNIFVNPAWNLGISKIKNEYFGILNDDLLLPQNIFSEILDFIKNTKKCGLVGLESSKIKQCEQINTYPKNYGIQFNPIKNIRDDKNKYWGTAIFGEKENYYKIPDDILIWCGDDYLIFKNKQNGKKCYAISNIEIFHAGSLTTGNDSLKKIKNRDKRLYSTIDNEFKKYYEKKRQNKIIESLKLEGFEKIFTIKNVDKRKYKLINIIGFKILIPYLKEITFSVILPTYNRAFCIENAIESLLNQSCQNFELIIIDDGSTDNTETLLKSKYKEYFETRRFIYKYIKHSGVSIARNIGLKMAKNDWIAYLDSDNILNPKFLASFRKNIKENDNYKCFYACCRYMNSDNVIGQKFSYKKLKEQNFINLGVFVHRKLLYKKYGGFDKSLKCLVDWDLILRYTKQQKPYFIKNILLHYNDNNSFVRISNTEDFNISKDKINKKYKNKI